MTLRVECLLQAGGRDSLRGNAGPAPMRPPPLPQPRKFPPTIRQHARQPWEGDAPQQVWANPPSNIMAHDSMATSQYRKVMKPKRGKGRPEMSREATRGPTKDNRRPRSDTEAATGTPGMAQAHKRAASDPTQR